MAQARRHKGREGRSGNYRFLTASWHRNSECIGNIDIDQLKFSGVYYLVFVLDAASFYRGGGASR